MKRPKKYPTEKPPKEDEYLVLNQVRRWDKGYYVEVKKNEFEFVNSFNDVMYVSHWCELPPLPKDL